MSEHVTVKRKDLEELIDMLEDALAVLEDPEPFYSKEELISTIEYVYSKLRQILKTQKKEVDKE